MDDLTLIGVPIDSVGRGGGTERGPAVLRELGLAAALGAEDRGDLDLRIRGEIRDPDSGILAGNDVLAATKALRETVAAAIDDGSRPLLAGGCCAELPGALAGARDSLGAVCLIHLDGHQDLYDGRSSPTGEAADMPISVALGLGPRAWVEAAGGPSVEPGRTVLLGYRDGAESIAHGMAQPSQLSAELTHLPIESLRSEGPATLARRITAALKATAPIWLHIDVDCARRAGLPRHRLPAARRHGLGRAGSDPRRDRLRGRPDRGLARLLQPRKGSRPALRPPPRRRARRPARRRLTGHAQASASIFAANSKSAAVTPPSEWVESRTVTVSQEISRSG